MKITFSLTQIEYVLTLYKHGHFAKAAKECNVTQPTLSMQIQKIEEDLGVVIFDRSTKPILLTAIGKELVTQMQAILFEAKKIELIIEKSKERGVSGTLVFGVIPTIAPYLLPLLLPKMSLKYPLIELKIFEMQTHKIIEALTLDEIDVGILATPLKEAKIYEYPLYYEPFSVLCHSMHELAREKRVKYEKLSYDDIWLLEEGHCLRNQVLDVCSIRKDKKSKRPFKFESGSLETLKNLVDSYGGFTLLPALAKSVIGKNSTILEFERPIPAREIGLVYQRAHYKNDLIEALGEVILESIPEEIRKIRPKDLEVLPI